METLKIQSTGRDNLYNLAYRDPRPEQAKRVVQSLVSIFVESSLGGKRKDTDAAKKFIDDQIKRYEKKLEEAEARLKDFKLRNIEIAAADGKDYFGRMGEVSAAAEPGPTRVARSREVARCVAQAGGRDEPSLLPDTAGARRRDLDAGDRCAHRGAGGNLDTCCCAYTDQHPDVVATQRLIASLEEQKRQEIAARTRAAAANPARAAAASSNAIRSPADEDSPGRGRGQRRVAARPGLPSTRPAMPGSRRRPSSCRRSRPNTRSSTATTTSTRGTTRAWSPRRESAEISGEMESTAGGAEFRLIDPPRVSPQAGGAEPPVAARRWRCSPRLGAGVVRKLCREPGLADVPRCAFAARCHRRSGAGVGVDDAERRDEAQGAPRPDRFIAGLVALLGSFGAGLFALFLLSLARRLSERP